MPEGNLLGERGRGYAQFLATLDDGRVAIAALAVGCIQACLDLSVEYALDRQTFGAPIGRKQGVAFQVADLEVMLHASRLLTYRAAAMKDGGAPVKEFKQAASIAKLLRHRVRGHRDPDRDAGLRRLRVHGGVRRRAALPRRQGARDRRGHLGGAADAHRPGSRPARRVVNNPLMRSRERHGTVMSGAVVLTLALTVLVGFDGTASGAEPTSDRGVAGTRISSSRLGATNTWAYDVNGSGVGYAAWVEGGDGKRRVLAARRSPSGHWGPAKALTGTFSWEGKRAYAGYPDVAVDDKGRATVVWTQSTSKGVRVKTASTSKRGWSAPRYLSVAGDSTGFPDIEVSANGYAVVHWAGHFGLGVTDFTLWSSYRARGGKWEPAQRLDLDPVFQPDARASEPAIDERGVATIVWDEIAGFDVNQSRTQVATRGPGTGWSTQTLQQAPDSNQPSVATTTDGRLVAAWREGGTIWTRRRGVDGAWAAPEIALSESPSKTNNATAVGIAASGEVVVYGEQVDLVRPKLRPYLLTQSFPGQPVRPGLRGSGVPDLRVRGVPQGLRDRQTWRGGDHLDGAWITPGGLVPHLHAGARRPGALGTHHAGRSRLGQPGPRRGPSGSDERRLRRGHRIVADRWMLHLAVGRAACQGLTPARRTLQAWRRPGSGSASRPVASSPSGWSRRSSR